MEYREISDLSFLNKYQKEWFSNYILYIDGTVWNNKTQKEVKKTEHGIRGYVINLSRHIDGKRQQRQICVARALMDLFVQPISEDTVVEYIDGDKKNINIKNFKIREMKQRSKNEI